MFFFNFFADIVFLCQHGYADFRYEGIFIKKTTPEETRETKTKEAFFQILGIFLETLLLWFIVFGTCLFKSV
jgi:hypothetical protein